MGRKTKISYIDSSINPVMGCTGCALYSPDPKENHCYAATLINRYRGLKGWPESFTEPEVFDHRIPQALNWPDLTGKGCEDKPWLNSYPRIVFVNDLGDGFCPDVDPHEWLTPYLERMANSPHIWLLLTKWPHRMAWYFNEEIGCVPKNFWLGTTVTYRGDGWRVEALMELDAVLWISVEPMLGEVSIGGRCRNCGSYWSKSDLLHSEGHCLTSEDCGTDEDIETVDWVVAGGESGPNARPTDSAWARRLAHQCKLGNIPFFYKQWGEWLPNDQLDGLSVAYRMGAYDCHHWTLGRASFRVGKHAAGRLLDGREWSEMPAIEQRTLF